MTVLFAANSTGCHLVELTFVYLAYLNVEHWSLLGSCFMDHSEVYKGSEGSLVALTRPVLSLLCQSVGLLDRCGWCCGDLNCWLTFDLYSV